MGEEFRNLLLQLGNLRFRITDMLHVLLDEEAGGAELQDDAKRVGGGFLDLFRLGPAKAFPAGSFQDFCQFVCVDGQDLLRRGTVEQQFGGGQAEDVGEKRLVLWKGLI